MNIHVLASMLMPLNPWSTAYVYTAQVIRRIIIVTAVLLMVMPNSFTIMLAIRGVATLNVVAVPARSAKSAKRSITLPRSPSACFPITGRQASEYLWRFLFLT